jgi:hypothetical protein
LAVSRAFGLPCEEPKVKVDQKDTEGMSALMYAAEMGHMQVPWIPLAKTGRFADRIIYLFFFAFSLILSRAQTTKCQVKYD